MPKRLPVARTRPEHLRQTADRARIRAEKTLDHKSAPAEKSARKPLPDTFSLPKDLARAKREAIEGLRYHGVIAEASRASGIGRRQFYNLMKSDEGFRLAVKDARNEYYDELERCMAERGHLPRGDLAGIFILKHRRKAFSEVQRIELTGSGGGPVQYTDTVKAELLARLMTVKQRAGLENKQEIVVNGKPQLVSGDGPKVRKAKV